MTVTWAFAGICRARCGIVVPQSMNTVSYGSIRAAACVQARALAVAWLSFSCSSDIVAADGAILNRNDVAAKTAKPLTVGGNVAANGNFGYAKPGRCVPQPQDTRFLNQPGQCVQPGIVCTYSAHLISAFRLSLRFIFRC